MIQSQLKIGEHKALIFFIKFSDEENRKSKIFQRPVSSPLGVHKTEDVVSMVSREDEPAKLKSSPYTPTCLQSTPQSLAIQISKTLAI